MRSDIELAVEQRDLDVSVDDFLLEELSALMFSALRRQVVDGFQETLMERTCEYILRVLGLTPKQARREVERVAGHPLLARDLTLVEGIGHGDRCQAVGEATGVESVLKGARPVAVQLRCTGHRKVPRCQGAASGPSRRGKAGGRLSRNDCTPSPMSGRPNWASTTAHMSSREVSRSRPACPS